MCFSSWESVEVSAVVNQACEGCLRLDDVVCLSGRAVQRQRRLHLMRVLACARWVSVELGAEGEEMVDRKTE